MTANHVGRPECAAWRLSVGRQSKDSRPSTSGVLMDNQGNVVGTMTEKTSVEHDMNRA